MIDAQLWAEMRVCRFSADEPCTNHKNTSYIFTIIFEIYDITFMKLEYLWNVFIAKILK